MGIDTRSGSGETAAPVCLSTMALADLATALAGRPDLWESQAVPSFRSMREGLRLVATDAWEAWLLTWPPGSSVQPHDHGGSNGAFVVCSGELAELRWRGGDRRTRWLVPGEVAHVRADVVHDVISVGPGTALSIHAYSPPLRQMRFYDDDAARVIAIEPVIEEPTVLDATVVASLSWTGAHV